MTSCTTNSPCSQGYCCEDRSSSSRYQTCTYFPSDCYTGDGTRDEYSSCSSNSQCATDCCHKSWNYCWGTTNTSSCMAFTLPSWGIVIIVIVVLVGIGLLIGCLFRRAHKNRRNRMRLNFSGRKKVTVHTPNESTAPMNNQPAAAQATVTPVTAQPAPQAQAPYHPQPVYPQQAYPMPPQPAQPGYAPQAYPPVQQPQQGYAPQAAFPAPQPYAPQPMPQYQPQPVAPPQVPLQPITQPAQPVAIPGQAAVQPGPY